MKNLILFLAYIFIAVGCFANNVEKELSPKTAKTGLWSNPNSWTPAGVPSASDEVTIPMGVVLELDGNCVSKNIMVMGQLGSSNSERNFDLKTGYIMVMGGGAKLSIGNASNPYDGEGTITLNGLISDPAPTGAPGNKFIMVMNGALLELNGTPQITWTELQGDVQPNSTQITLTTAVSWPIGSEIVIASSRKNGEEAEKFKILSKSNGNKTLHLDGALQYPHYGEEIPYSRVGKTWYANMRAEVGLLSRNLKIQGDAASEVAGYGAHIMIMGGMGNISTSGIAKVDGVEFYRMGQKSMLGRYPFHWHMVKQLGAGQYFKNSSVHLSYNRALTIHGTDGTQVINNFFYDHLGHGLFLEDGTERFNEIKHNVVLLTKRPAPGEEIAFSDNKLNQFQNRSPSSYWITNPNNIFEDNVAAGTSANGFPDNTGVDGFVNSEGAGTGFWFALPRVLMGQSKDDSLYFKPHTRAAEEILGSFKRNKAHSCMSGFDIFDNLTDSHVPGKDSIIINGGWYNSQEKIIEDCTWYSNHVGVYSGIGGELAFPDSVIYRNNIFVDNHIALLLASYNTAEECVFVAESGKGTISGNRYLHTTYDGAGKVKDSHLVGWNASDAFLILQSGASVKHVNHRFSGITTDPPAFPNIFLDDVSGIAPPNIQFGNVYHPRRWNDVILDVDGSLSGNFPNQKSIVSNHPMHLVGGEATKPNWTNAYITDRKYALQYFRFFLSNVNNWPNTSTVRTKVGTPRAGVYFIDGQHDIHQMAVIVNDDFLYTTRFESLPSDRQTILYMDDATIGDSYLMRIPEFGNFGGLTLRKKNLISVGGNSPLSESSSLAALNQSNTTGYWINPNNGDLYIRQVAIQRSNYVYISWTETGIVMPKIDSDGDGTSDGDEAGQERDPFTEKDLAHLFSTNGDPEEWSVNETSGSVSDGLFCGTSTTGDPKIIKTDYNFHHGAVPYIMVRFKADETRPIQIFWERDIDTGFSGTRVLSQTYNGNGEWQTIIFDMNSHALWSNRITALRIDPLNAANKDFKIDWIVASDGNNDNDQFPDASDVCPLAYNVPVVTSVETNYCVSQTNATLPAGSPIGGYWSGAGVVGTNIYLNAGGTSNLDLGGVTWVPDLPYVVGAAGGSPDNSEFIGNTFIPEIYNTERWRSNLEYKVPVTPGSYLVQVHFAETFSRNQIVGNRVFGLTLEGILVENSIDIFAEAGADTALIKSYYIESDDFLNINFNTITENPKVCGISIISQNVNPASLGVGTHDLVYNYNDPVSGCYDTNTSTITVHAPPAAPSVSAAQSVCSMSAPIALTESPDGGTWSGTGIIGSPIYINSGGGEVTEDGITWMADQYNAGGSVSNQNPATGIGGTSNQEIYKSERWSSNDLKYNIPVASGDYQVQVHFAELYPPNQIPGTRVFDVQLEGTTVETGIDVFNQAGAATALFKTYDVTISDGTLNLVLKKNVANPMISGIAILPKTFDPVAAGIGTKTLTYTYTDPLSGCTSSKTTTVTVAAPPTANALGTNAICPGESTLLSGTSTGSGAKTYKWYIAGTNTLVSSSQNATVSPTVTTSYELVTTATVSGAGNCTSNRSTPITVTVNPLPSTPTVSATQTVCERANTVLTATPVGGVWSGTGIVGSPIYINAGGPAITEEGISWLADIYSTNGSTSNFGNPNISGTAGQTVYKTERWSGSNLSYAIPVTSGEYQVQVHFAELHAPSQNTGARVFNVQLEGSTVESNVDIYDEVGAATALIKTYSISITDGTLNLNLASNPGNPKVSAISVLPKSFSGETAGQGAHVLTYDYIDPLTGCAKSTTTTFTVSAPPVATANGNTSICTGESAQLLGSTTGSGAKTYKWYQGMTNTLISSQQNPTVSPTTTTSYELETTVAGCGSYRSAPVTIVVNALPATPTVSNAQTICERGPDRVLTATPEGGVWSGTGIIGSPIYINAGGPTVTEAGITWLADQSFTNGNTASFNPSISNTAGQTVYKSERWMNGTLEYNIPVANGEYEVQIHLAEIHVLSQTVGGRVFDIELEGTMVETAVDIFDEVGANTALIKTYSVTIADGMLDLDLAKNPGNPKISAISILPKGFRGTTAGPGNHVLTYDYIDPVTGCAKSNTTTYTVTPAPVSTATGTTSICTGESTTLNGTASGSGTKIYRWYVVGTNIVASQQQNFTVSPTQTTSYVLIAIVNNCWSYASSPVTVTVNALPGVPIVPSAQTFCERGTTLALSGTPAGGTWSGNGVSGTNFTPATAGPGVHTITYEVTNANGCSNSNTTTFTVDAAPVASVSGAATICTGQSTTLSASATGTGTKIYTWYVAGTNTAVHQGQTYTVSPTSTTSYDILANVGGCLSYRSASVTVTVTATGTPTVPSAQTFCERGATVALVASPSGGVWSGNGVTGSNFNPTTAGSGVHTLTYVYSNNGCSGSNTTTFTVDAAPVATVSGSVSNICAGREVTLNGSTTASGATISYQWYIAGTSTQVSTLQSPTVAPLVDTDYKMIVTVDGCASYPSSTVSVDVDPTNSICLSGKALLDGPFSAGLMQDDLKENGLLALTEPYTSLGFSGLDNTGITVPASVFNGTGANNDIVDWIVVQLRDKNNHQNILASAAMLLEQDGEIVTYAQGRKSNVLSFSMPHDDYYLAIFHRNHLPVMTQNPVSLNGVSTIFDFTLASTVTYGNDAQIELSPGVWGLIAGDANRDLLISAPDRSVIWNFRNQSGYLLPDVTLDGLINAADRSKAWNNRNRFGTIDY